MKMAERILTPFRQRNVNSVRKSAILLSDSRLLKLLSISGLISASFLIFNSVVGTGIYSTPSLILRLSGSPGMSLVVWLIGALIASAGTAVYVEFGTGLPRSGAEKNYLEFIYRKPKYLATCVYAFLTILIVRDASSNIRTMVLTLLQGWAAANGVIFGDCECLL